MHFTAQGMECYPVRQLDAVLERVENGGANESLFHGVFVSLSALRTLRNRRDEPFYNYEFPVWWWRPLMPDGKSMCCSGFDSAKRRGFLRM
jgi:hypothetical protein